MRVSSTDGVDVAVHDLGGRGRTLLLLHATGFHGRCYVPLARALHDAAHSFALDFRGHGDTAQPPAWDVRWSGFGDDAVAVAARVADSGPVVGFGHSMGGAALLMAGLRRPELFDALVLFEPIVFPPEMAGRGGDSRLAAGARRRRPAFASFDEAYANFAAKAPLASFTPEALRAYVENGFHRQDDGTVRLACPPELEAAIFETGADHDTWSRLGELAVPVWVLSGRVVEGQPSARAAAIARRLPRATYVESGDLGHFGPMTHPGRVAQTVREVIERAR